MLGISFADNLDYTLRKFKKNRSIAVDTTELITMDKIADETGTPSIWKRVGLKIIVFLLMGLLIAHIGVLQIIRGKYYRAIADGNGIVKRPLEAPRGVIVDRTGLVIVRNTPYITVNDKELKPYKEVVQSQSTSSAQTKDLKITSIREYQFSKEFSHLTGYISPISQEEIEKNKKIASTKTPLYALNDQVGRTGIEEEYEEFLRGKSGAELVEVNALGEVQHILGKEEAKPGYTIKTGIDSNLQKFAYQQLEETVKKAGGLSGVVVVQNPNTGEILSIVNYPSYDNNIFTVPGRKKELQAIFGDAQTPLLNRAISGTYPPGSTFKMVTALAGLESKKITTQTTYDDTGSITLSGTTFNNWYFSQYGKNEGLVDVRKALARSNDTFFYKMALETGVDTLVEQARKFKFGQTLGIDIPGESRGLIPTPEWKQQEKNEQWYPGNTVNMSIGQGDVLTTPLQITAMTSAIAVGGTIYQPVLATAILDSKNNPICTHDFVTGKWKGQECDSLNKHTISPTKLNLNVENINAVREGMKLVAQRGGTAFPFFDFKIETAGKTGTAESQPGKKPHAWYTGFAPYSRPEITVTALIEQGGEGSQIAAPLVKEIMNYYFTHQSSHIVQN